MLGVGELEVELEPEHCRSQCRYGLITQGYTKNGDKLRQIGIKWSDRAYQIGKGKKVKAVR